MHLLVLMLSNSFTFIIVNLVVFPLFSLFLCSLIINLKKVKRLSMFIFLIKVMYPKKARYKICKTD